VAAPDLGPLDQLRDRANTLAGAWSARALASTTVGRERALLRLLGVSGVDAARRPLAWATVDRHVASSPAALGAGIVLPFAMAIVEYDVPPQQVALDAAAGTIDLAAEAELLAHEDRRAIAETEARRLAQAALDRIDANRTARRELSDLLGEPPRPWIGATIRAPGVDAARNESLAAIAAGADLIRIDVPIGRELTTRLQEAGLDAPVWRAADGRIEAQDGSEEAPAGSQRALATLRRAMDEAAAERRSYVRLAVTAAPLSAPESAVVSAFERIDLADADPMTEIVAGRVDPDRAIVDHAFAHRLLARAGVVIAIGAGPLAVAPDLASGQPSDPPLRSGRALALQLLSVAIARRNGVPDRQIVLGALPAWLTGEARPAARAAAEVALRRALHPDLPLLFDEPVAGRAGVDPWAAIVAAVQPLPGTGLIIRRASSALEAAIGSTRESATVVADLTGSFGTRPLAGPALDHARASARAALDTIDRLSNEGWRSILGDEPKNGDRGRLGADAVADLTEAFDPFGLDAPAA
jgi:hypothetical protein